MPGSGDGIGMACVWVGRIDRFDYSKRRSMPLRTGTFDREIIDDPQAGFGPQFALV
jgi:hypothetical protein